MRCGTLDFEVINSVFEHTVVFVAVHVFIYVIRIPLGVPHFAEDAAVGGGDTLNREVGAVRVITDFHGRVAVFVHILRRDLPVVNELLQQFRRADETTFAVGIGTV